jgi:hypothetical protein
MRPLWYKSFFIGATYASFNQYLPEPLNFCGKAYEGYYDHGMSGVPFDDAIGCLAHLAITGLALHNGIAYFIGE